MSYAVECRPCKKKLDIASPHVACPACSGPLDFRYSGAKIRTGDSMWKYRDFLPVGPRSKIISLNEGWTPLVPARFQENVFIKNETVNPTGSHKDRPLSVGVTKAVEFGRDTVMLYSDGSTALSSAAYAARAGLRSITVFGRGAPDYRLLPLMIYGSHLLEYRGTGGEALDWVHEACQKLGIYETSTYRLANPYQAEAPKTIGYEIFEQLGRAPDWVVVPVGGGGTFAGIWRAFVELNLRPRMVGVLPAGYTMMMSAISETELRALAPKKPPPTIQVKTAMSYAPDGMEVVSIVRESGGMLLSASDDEAVAAQKKLGAREGIYAEPSAAVSIVGVEKLKVKKNETVVAVVTGSGFRETGALADRVKVNRISVDGKTGFSVLEKILRR